MNFKINSNIDVLIYGVPHSDFLISNIINGMSYYVYPIDIKKIYITRKIFLEYIKSFQMLSNNSLFSTLNCVINGCENSWNGSPLHIGNLLIRIFSFRKNQNDRNTNLRSAVNRSSIVRMFVFRFLGNSNTTDGNLKPSTESPYFLHMSIFMLTLSFQRMVLTC